MKTFYPVNNALTNASPLNILNPLGKLRELPDLEGRTHTTPDEGHRDPTQHLLFICRPEHLPYRSQSSFPCHSRSHHHSQRRHRGCFPLRDTCWTCRRLVWATYLYSSNCAYPNNRWSETGCDQDLWQELKKFQDNTCSHSKEIPLVLPSTSQK